MIYEWIITRLDDEIAMNQKRMKLRGQVERPFIEERLLLL